ncbi:MAG TPA: hypothetical protein VH062_35930 [Polyangiaceae bacterium]|jgi:hypothetical protein|nr:hypothetical protein [Polyangiaceae bacterium]
METNNVNVTTATDQMLFEEPFNELLPEFEALTAEQVTVVNLDIPAAVTTVLGVAPAIVEMKDALAALPDFNTERAANLRTYALAMSHAHTLYLMAVKPPDSLQPLAEAGAALHATLLTDANALVQRKLIDGQQLKDLQGVVGYRNIAFDLQILAQTFRNAGASIAGKCATQPEEIQRAEQIAEGLLQSVGTKELSPATVAAVTDMRSRAFTAFVNAYDQVRRAVSYLRWDSEDADTVAPSLYAGKVTSKKKPDAPQPPATTPVPDPTGTQPGTPPAIPVVDGTSNGAKTGPGAQPFVNVH